MRPIVALFVIFVAVLHPALLRAQSAPSTPETSVPRLIQISGVYHPADGQLAAPVEAVTVAIYAEETGGTPLWQETQSISLDGEGRYSVLLGATETDGVPLDVFASGEARWLELTFAPAAAGEGLRTRLTSVPYALTAGDAVTLGGHPASAYLRAPSTGGDGSVATASTATSVAPSDPTVTTQAVLPGTPNALAKYVDASDVGASTISEVAGRLGINTGAALPADYLHVKFTDPFGAFTGLALQNMSNNANAASGMLFYDHNGVLSQFQGFNNTNHAYVINNIARNGASQFDGSYNFLIGNASRLFVSTGGTVGIGTTAPASLLEVSNASSTLSFAQITASTFVNTGQGSLFVGRKARGTSAAPAAVLGGDTLAGYLAQGYGASGFSGTRGGMFVVAAENWSNAAQGTRLAFNTTNTGTTTPGTRMTLDASGNLGIGTTTPQLAVDVVRDGDDAAFQATSFNAGGCCAGFVARMARGTAAAPSAVQLGDPLALFMGDGYGATQFSSEAGGMLVLAAENWTDTAQGSAVAFTTTALGTSDDGEVRMVIMPDGKVGIGTFTEFPTLGDKLQVFGDIRVGTSGTNGCINNFAGTGLVGTCSSDARLKKDITPFGPALDQLTSLQPVHYYWRATEFPDRHLGDSRAYGLIAQDAEAVLPELVVTAKDGFKAVDYSKLPLLTIQAMKELKSENDALNLRIAELERLMTEVLVATGRR